MANRPASALAIEDDSWAAPPSVAVSPSRIPHRGLTIRWGPVRLASALRYW